MEGAERKKQAENPELFKEKLLENYQLVLDRLAAEEAEGLQYVVVGGVALAAHLNLGENLFFRENKTVRDLDVVILEDPNERYSSLEAEFRLKKGEFILPVTLNQTKPADYHSHTQMLVHFKKKGSGYGMVFRSVEKELPPELLEPQQASVNVGERILKFKTFEPGVILHLYIQRTGSIKQKDIEKLVKFARENQSVREVAKQPGTFNIEVHHSRLLKASST